MAMGRKLIRLREKLAQSEFEKMLEQIGVTLEETEISMAMARQETT
jgi:hypothetical protein